MAPQYGPRRARIAFSDSAAKQLADAASRVPKDGATIGHSVLTQAEIEYAVHREMAMTVSDVLVRRTGSFFWSADGDASVIDDVSDTLGTAHGYTAEQRTAQQRDYRHWVERNRGKESF
ncbi:glycerol-3-phosphate dehydrogenase C-terminal domain-containing protein [Streptomyces sp. NPDC058439]|uniref:glycerol-3-phosphate dehydrogenase C-terminal domain-containing protein n=1 Tax=Streptomyces sp. NPDC058439 TaxID=3346500 RepID=UPI00365CE93C